MTKLWLSVLCLVLAATSVIRCDSDSSSDRSSDNNGADGDSGVEDSAACSAIAQYLSGDVTAPADQSQLLDSFFNDFNFDIEQFALKKLPELVVNGHDFTFDIQVLRANFDNFRNFINSSVVQPILGDFLTAFESVAQAAESSQTSDIDRVMIKNQVRQLLTKFKAAIEPCELDRFDRKIRNLFEIDIFGQLVAIAECNAGFNSVNGFIAAANATVGLFPDILEITFDFVEIIPFVIGENYVLTVILLIVRPYFFPFESREDAAEKIFDVFTTYIDTDDLCGIVPSGPIIDIFDRLFNEEYLDFIASKI